MTVVPSKSQFQQKNMLWLEITNFCNLHCAHCYNSSGTHESLTPSISPERYEAIIDDASRMGFRSIQFIGGEPIFYPQLQRLVDAAVIRQFDYIEIFSNLTVLPKWLLNHNYKKINIATSFYSHDPLVHDKICEAPKSFERTTASIRKVIDADMELRVGFIEMESNSGHFEATSAYLKILGVKNIGYDRAREFGRAEQNKKADITELCGKCGDGNLSIDVNGNVSGCIMSKPWAFGNVNEKSIDDIFTSAERKVFVEQLDKTPKRIEPVGCNPTDRDCNPACNPCGPYCGPNCSPACGPQSGGCNPNCAPSCHPACFPCNPGGCSPKYSPTNRTGYELT
jgi:MoaA/NifB/PqqE/SkfB family radical SAM enzyme